MKRSVIFFLFLTACGTSNPPPTQQAISAQPPATVQHGQSLMGFIGALADTINNDGSQSAITRLNNNFVSSHPHADDNTPPPPLPPQPHMWIQNNNGVISNCNDIGGMVTCN